MLTSLVEVSRLYRSALRYVKGNRFCNARQSASRLIPLLLLFGCVSAHSACFNPLGCAPKNHDECVAEATKRPTELGVKLARQQCYAKWVAPEEERRSAERAAVAVRRAVLWEKMPDSGETLGIWLSKLGDPDMVLGPYPCSRLKDAKSPGVPCYTYRWKDDRPGRYDAYFKVEVLNNAEKTVWAFWRDSLSN